MNRQQSQKSRETRTGDPLVICRTEEGFRVYAASDPARSYTVSGSVDDPSCTCPDFQYPEGNAPWYCKHIQAVMDQVKDARDARSNFNRDEIEERLAIQQEGSANEKTEESRWPTHMFIKRSVSPDGRIDSLSVEFSCPVQEVSAGDIKSKALASLRLQSEIVSSFLKQNGNGNGNNRPAEQKQESNGTTPATLLGVGGQDGKWGRRLYLNLRSNGQVLRLFGGRKQLQEQLAAAGYADSAEQLYEGMQMNLPCRIITQRSDDGNWLNVEQVLPANTRSAGSTVQR